MQEFETGQTEYLDDYLNGLETALNNIEILDAMLVYKAISFYLLDRSELKFTEDCTAKAMFALIKPSLDLFLQKRGF